MNSRTFGLAKELEFRLRPSPAYEHQLNGSAERCIQTLMDRARCLRCKSGLSKQFWSEIVQAAKYIQYIGNRLLSSSTYERLCPYEIFFRKKLCISNLRVYGSKAFVHIPDELRKTQDDKSREGMLVGYSDVGYRILIGRKVTVARCLRFIERESGSVKMENNSSSGEVEKKVSSKNYRLNEECVSLISNENIRSFICEEDASKV